MVQFSSIMRHLLLYGMTCSAALWASIFPSFESSHDHLGLAQLTRQGKFHRSLSITSWWCDRGMIQQAGDNLLQIVAQRLMLKTQRLSSL